MQKMNLVTGFLMAVIGLLLLFIPAEVTRVIVIVLGAEAIVNGIVNLISTRNLIADESFRLSMLIRGVVSIVVGLLAVFLPIAFVQTMLDIVCYGYAIYLLFASVLELYVIAKLRGTGLPRKQYAAEVLISIVVAIILFILPKDVLGTLVLRILGAIVLIIGALYIYVTLRNQKIDETIIESVVVEDDDNNN